MTALLIDLDGVLYEADRPLPGATETLAWIESSGIPHLFLTNTTSRSRRALVEKLGAMGIDADAHNILTPLVAAARWLEAHTTGPTALFVAPAAVEEFAALDIATKDQTAAASVVIGDYAERWSYAELNRAFRLLVQEPHPALVALGMTRYWQAADGLRLDVAPFIAALTEASGVEPVVLGKPAGPFFETALEMLNATPNNTLMIGDDVRGDIGGAQAVGIAGALVRTGKFRPEDLTRDIQPEFVLDSIAELPQRWAEIEAVLKNA